jgi:hypothetical protein
MVHRQTTVQAAGHLRDWFRDGEVVAPKRLNRQPQSSGHFAVHHHTWSDARLRVANYRRQSFQRNAMFVRKSGWLSWQRRVPILSSLLLPVVSDFFTLLIGQDRTNPFQIYDL